MPDHVIRRGRGEQGFALIEILVAIAIISIGLLGLAGAMAVQSGGVSSAIAMGQGAVTRGYYVSTAALLAQDKLEQVKHLRYCLTCGTGGVAVDELATFPTGFQANESPVAGYANFNRQVSVQAYPAGTNMKTVTVTVTYSVPMATSVNTESVVLSTLVAARP